MEYELRETRQFQKWLKKVDRQVRLTVVVRLARVEKGNLGDHRSVGGSVSKLIHLDTGLVVETYSRITSEAMTAQSRSLMEMSTPVTQIWEGVLFLPIVGIVDSKRAQEIMNATLTKISQTQSRAYQRGRRCRYRRGQLPDKGDKSHPADGV